MNTVLGIESTAHTLGIGIVNEEEILANQKEMFEPEKGGIHPRKAAEQHHQNLKNVLNNALDEAGLEISEIDCVGFSQGPGLPQPLDIAGVASRALSHRFDIPIVGVNHCISHITIGKRVTEAEDPTTLYLSGGNSQVIHKKSGRYRVVGETQDIALGNALDKLARKMGYPYPGGPEIEREANKTNEIVELSYPVKGMDFSFSGLVTETQRKIGDVDNDVLCNSFQEHAFAATVEALERAMALNKSDEALLTGGVAMNDRLRTMIRQMCEDRDANFYVPDPEYCMDNGVMIAHQALLKLSNGEMTSIKNSGKKPNWRPDEVPVNW